MTEFYDQLGEALAVGLLADRMGSPTGPQLLADVELFLGPEENPLGKALASVLRSAGRVLRRIRISPRLVLALGAAVGVYEWMTASERIQAQQISAAYGQAHAVLSACVESGDTECVRSLASAAADAQRQVSKLAGIDWSTVLVVGGLGIGALLFLGRRA